jgi:hypothetical protein
MANLPDKPKRSRKAPQGVIQRDPAEPETTVC